MNTRKSRKEPEMTHKQALTRLKKLGACGDAVTDFANAGRSPQDYWDSCDRGDWMLWLAGKFAGGPESEGRKRHVLAACKCARLALKHVPKGELRPQRCIETAERWAKGKDRKSVV